MRVQCNLLYCKRKKNGKWSHPLSNLLFSILNCSSYKTMKASYLIKKILHATCNKIDLDLFCCPLHATISLIFSLHKTNYFHTVYSSMKHIALHVHEKNSTLSLSFMVENENILICFVINFCMV